MIFGQNLLENDNWKLLYVFSFYNIGEMENEVFFFCTFNAL